MFNFLLVGFSPDVLIQLSSIVAFMNHFESPVETKTFIAYLYVEHCESTLRNLIFLFTIRGRGEAKKAADCLRTALREYNLKFGTILNDPDLASFRASPEFKELQEEVYFLVVVICFFCSFRDSKNLASIVQPHFAFYWWSGF